jgi:hypothetical protein
MIGDPLKKVTTGQPFVPNAASWNAFADTARAHLQRQSNSAKPYRPALGDRATTALVQNTGSDVGRFGFLSITAPIVAPATNLDEFSNYLAFQCGAAAANTPFVITLEPIAANAVGMAVVAGAVQCQVNVNSASDQFAALDSSGILQSGASGPAQILWKASGTGSQWAVVNLGNPSTASTILCRVAAAATGAQYTVIEQVANGAGFVDKPGASNITATNMAEATVGPGGAVDANTRVLVCSFGGNYVFDHPVYAKYLS